MVINFKDRNDKKSNNTFTLLILVLHSVYYNEVQSIKKKSNIEFCEYYMINPRNLAPKLHEFYLRLDNLNSIS